MKTITKKTYPFIFMLSLTACMNPTKPIAPPLSSESKIKSNLTAKTLTQWQASGSMAAKQNKKGWSASFVWNQHDLTHYTVTLFGPMGGGAIYLNKKGNQLEYKTKDEYQVTTQPDKFLYQKTGLLIPVDVLSYWMKGLPANGPVQSLDYYPDGTVKHFSQAGYQLTYTQYQTVGPLRLPRKIDIRHPQGFMKLFIQAWKP